MRRGFTLVELLVAMAIGLVVVQIAFASFVVSAKFIQRIRRLDAANQALQAAFLSTLSQPHTVLSAAKPGQTSMVEPYLDEPVPGQQGAGYNQANAASGLVMQIGISGETWAKRMIGTKPCYLYSFVTIRDFSPAAFARQVDGQLPITGFRRRSGDPAQRVRATVLGEFPLPRFNGFQPPW